MTSQTSSVTVPDSRWLSTYYFLRAEVSALWIGAAFTVGKDMPAVGGGLLIAYPAWDAVANLIDAQRSGGLQRNPGQLWNMIVSTLTAIAVAVALGQGMNAVLTVYGAWAILAGLLQLFTAIRRWKTGAQWAMVLSGAQSALAGGFFVKLAMGAAPDALTIIPGYAGIGAVYFLISAIWLVVVRARRAAKTVA